MTHIGIDYGARKAGTTAVCFEENNQLVVRSSRKGQDADLFILAVVSKVKPPQIFIDAPLSLPPRFSQGKGDYFYRKGDRDLSAMSPMFLGALTARAVKLADELRTQGIEVFETYPKALVQALELEPFYQKREIGKLKVFIEQLVDNKLIDSYKKIASWHELDAVLAWLSGSRYRREEAVSYGNKSEGLIWV